MKAFTYSKHGDSMDIIDVPIPEPANNAMRIRVHAFSFNPIDYKRRQGIMKDLMPEKQWPVIMGYDASGIVDAVGSDIKKFKKGDEVYVKIGYEFHAQVSYSLPF